MGRTHRPFYRICIMDKLAPRDGSPIEEVGTYDPMVQDKSKRVVLNLERVKYWVSVGAQPSDKVAVLIDKFEKGNWGAIKSPPPLTPPKEKKAAAPAEEAAPAEAPAAEG
jgi:small subunit ribosomal protein S16